MRNLFFTQAFFLCVTCGFSLGCQTPENGHNQTTSAAEPPSRLGTQVTAIDGGIHVIFQDSQDHYWFGGGAKGLYRFDGQSLQLFTQSDGLCSHDVIGIQSDPDGNLYFDTLAGVSRFDGQTFTTLPISASPAAENAWKMETGDLWFRMGWDHPGPFRFDGTQLHALALPTSPEEAAFRAQFPQASYSPYGLYSLYQDSAGTLWFGTSSLGICRFDGASHSWLFERHITETPSGGAFGVRAIFEDRDGFFWFNHPRYRYQILPGSGSTTSPKHLAYRKEGHQVEGESSVNLADLYFCSVVQDAIGDVWMATFAEGVWRKKGAELLHYPVQIDQRTVHLNSIYLDQEGVLWLATQKDGAFRFDGTNFLPFQF